MSFSPQQRALLDTIAMAEGTFAGGDPRGYRIMFGGGEMPKGSMRHPDTVVRRPGYASAAAGRYQFMPPTWGEVRQALNLKEDDFGRPEVQDQAALFLAQRRGVKTDQLGDTLDPKVLNKLAPEWASLPTLEGKSYHGQPVKKLGDLQSFYSQRLGHWKKQGGGVVASNPETGGPAGQGSTPAPQAPPGQPAPSPAKGSGEGATEPPAQPGVDPITQKIEHLQAQGKQLQEFNQQMQQYNAERAAAISKERRERSAGAVTEFAGDLQTQRQVALAMLNAPLVESRSSARRDRG